MVFRGVIIEESLSDSSVLGEFKITATKVEKVTEKHCTPHLEKWTLHTVEVPVEKAGELAEKLSRTLLEKPVSWYADYRDAGTHYIIFPRKVFRIPRSDSAGFREAREYGISIGIPPHQVGFKP